MSKVEEFEKDLKGVDIKNETISDRKLKENRIQKIDCFCGKIFEFDWSKIPNNDKFVYVRCPFCDSEIKLKNMYFEDNDNKDKNSLEDNNIDLMDVVKYAQELFSLKYEHCIVEKEEHIYHLLYVDNSLLKSKFGGHNVHDYYYNEEVISFLGTKLGLLKNPIPMSSQRYQVDVDESKTEVKQLDSFKCEIGLWIKGEDYTICYDYPPFSTIERQSLESKYNIPYEMSGACYVFEVLKNSDSKYDASYWGKIVEQALIFLEDKQKIAIEYFIKKLYEENSISLNDMLDFFKKISVKPDIMKEFLLAYTNQYHFEDIIKKNNLSELKLSVLEYFVKLVEES